MPSISPAPAWRSTEAARAPGMEAIRPVHALQARVVQRRTVAGRRDGGLQRTLARPRRHGRRSAVNLGYADGYWRAFTNRGHALAPDGQRLPVRGRVSMDLTILDLTNAPEVREGGWMTFPVDLPSAPARTSGMSQYELLTGLGPRPERVWR